jgi:hypothetical protein
MDMRRLAIGTLTLALLATACGSDSETGRTPDSMSAAPAPPDTSAASVTTGADVTNPSESVPSGEPAAEGWTILVYSIADTDLEPFMMDDVTEMGSVGSGPGLNIVGLVDRSADYSADPVLGLGDWQGAKLLHVQEGSAEVLNDLGDVNTGDPQLLADFITTSVTNFPAARYSLIISDHGASWPGVGGDESSQFDTLSLAELEAGIQAGLAGAGLDKFDLLGFDACLMATYEVASELAPYADRLLASQELEPGHGWDYGALQLLNDSPDTDVDTLGSALIDGFEAQAKAQDTSTEITLSLVDLTKMGTVDAAMNEFTTALTARAAALGPIIGRERANVLSFGRNPDPANDTHMVDLGILVSEIGIDALDVSNQADTVIRAINDSVIDSVAGAATRGATGLSIYFPPQQTWFSSDYYAVEAAAGWAGFLDAYYTGGAEIPTDEQPQFEGDDADIFFDQDGLNVSGVFDLAAAGNITTATIDYGIVDADGTITFIGVEPAAVADDGSGQALGIFDLTVLTISDGQDTVYAYLDMRIDEESGLATIDVPLAYYPPGDDTASYDDVLLSLVFDSDGNIVSETYYVYNDETDTYGELTTEPDGIIVPLVYQSNPDGTGEWVPTSDVGLYADLPNLVYDLEPLESGTQLYVELTVSDFGGNEDFVSAYTTVP